MNNTSALKVELHETEQRLLAELRTVRRGARAGDQISISSPSGSASPTPSPPIWAPGDSSSSNPAFW
jgi:hypothetical protein